LIIFPIESVSNHLEDDRNFMLQSAFVMKY